MADRPDMDSAGTASTRPGAWREVRTVAEVASTNAALAAEAERGAPEGLVLVAERQTAGRGRLGRTWTSPPGTGLTFSVLLRPDVPASRLGWLPLLAGLAVAEHLDSIPGLSTPGLSTPGRPTSGPPTPGPPTVSLKWPNDVMVRDRKLAGVLAERVPSPRADLLPAVVLGIGLNVSTTADQLPVPEATSLAVELSDEAPDRLDVLQGVLDVLAARYRSWSDAAGDADACGLRPAYTVRCATVGRRVRVTLPGEELEGEAIGIDPDGALRLADPSTDAGVRTIHAGDVVHLR